MLLQDIKFALVMHPRCHYQSQFFVSCYAARENAGYSINRQLYSVFWTQLCRKHLAPELETAARTATAGEWGHDQNLSQDKGLPTCWLWFHASFQCYASGCLVSIHITRARKQPGNLRKLISVSCLTWWSLTLLLPPACQRTCHPPLRSHR